MIAHKHKQLDGRLRKLSYAETDRRMQSLNTETLFSLLDSSSVRVGDTAASLLSRREQERRVLQEALGDRFRTKFGKMRALSILHGQGKRMPETIELEINWLSDRNDDVVSRALFGLVMRLYKPVLPKIDLELVKYSSDTYRHKILHKAQEAILRENPFSCFPSYSRQQAKELWGIAEKMAD